MHMCHVKFQNFHFLEGAQDEGRWPGVDGVLAEPVRFQNLRKLLCQAAPCGGEGFSERGLEGLSQRMLTFDLYCPSCGAILLHFMGVRHRWKVVEQREMFGCACGKEHPPHDGETDACPAWWRDLRLGPENPLIQLLCNNPSRNLYVEVSQVHPCAVNQPGLMFRNEDGDNLHAIARVAPARSEETTVNVCATFEKNNRIGIRLLPPGNACHAAAAGGDESGDAGGAPEQVGGGARCAAPRPGSAGTWACNTQVSGGITPCEDVLQGCSDYCVMLHWQAVAAAAAGAAAGAAAAAAGADPPAGQAPIAAAPE